MVLVRVIYELFATEAGTPESADRGGPVYLDRQLRLEFANSPPLYVSWTWGALPESEYHVGWSHDSFYRGVTEIEYDATNTSAWADLVGHALSLQYFDSNQQVLEIRTSNAAVFCCSFEQRWRADTLYVGSRMPEGAGDPAAA